MTREEVRALIEGLENLARCFAEVGLYGTAERALLLRKTVLDNLLYILVDGDAKSQDSDERHAKFLESLGL